MALIWSWLLGAGSRVVVVVRLEEDIFVGVYIIFADAIFRWSIQSFRFEGGEGHRDAALPAAITMSGRGVAVAAVARW